MSDWDELERRGPEDSGPAVAKGKWGSRAKKGKAVGDGEMTTGIHQHKRAGGLEGFTEKESWWHADGVCARAKTHLMNMTPLERVCLVGDEDVRRALVNALDEVKAEWARRDAEEIPKILEAKGKYPRKKTVRPYWMRTIESVDMTKPGSQKLVGDWVIEAEECDDGELVVVGLRYPEKVYAVCRVKKGERVRLFEALRPDIEFDGLVSLGEWPGFAQVLDVARRELGLIEPE